jgi:hypothetical protein
LAEPLAPLPYQAPIEATADFDGIVDALEALWLSFKDLIAQIVAQLVRRGLGAQQLKVTFLRPYAAAVEKTIELSSPSRNPTILFNLIRCAMETIGDAKPTRSKRPTTFKLRPRAGAGAACPEPVEGRRPGCLSIDDSDFVPRGFTGLRLAVPLSEPLTEEQIFLLEQEEHTSRQELDRLIERLRLRLGEESLVGVEPVESYVPERAYRTQGSGFRVQEKKTKASLPEPSTLNPEPSCRPLHLLPTPRELRVMVQPSDDRDGAPVAFSIDNQTHRIVHAVGPERIAGAWWLGHDKTRDYYDVEDDTGRRWWVFRVLETFKWYLHGVYE